MSKSKLQVVSVKVEPELWKQFRATVKPFTASAVVKWLMQKIVDGELNVELGVDKEK